MPSLTEWSAAREPATPGRLWFDLDRALASVVGLHSIIHRCLQRGNARHRARRQRRAGSMTDWY